MLLDYDEKHMERESRKHESVASKSRKPAKPEHLLSNPKGPKHETAVPSLSMAFCEALSLT
jgi:hypothetical protein